MLFLLGINASINVTIQENTNVSTSIKATFLPLLWAKNILIINGANIKITIGNSGIPIPNKIASKWHELIYIILNHLI